MASNTAPTNTQPALRTYDWDALVDQDTSRYLDQICSDLSQQVAVLELFAAALRRECNSAILTDEDQINAYYAKFVQIRRLMIASRAMQSALSVFRLDNEETTVLSPLYHKYGLAREVQFGPDPAYPRPLTPVEDLPSAPASPTPSKVKCPGAPLKKAQPKDNKMPTAIPFKIVNDEFNRTKTKSLPRLKMPPRASRVARKSAPPSRYLRAKAFN